MSIKSKNNTHFLVAMLFSFLAISLVILMTIYWFFVLNPRLHIEAESNAKILAESQAKIISIVLSSKIGNVSQIDINELNDQILVFIDPVLKRPYFLGVSFELDDEVLESDSSTLDLSEGNLLCQNCFSVTTALYSHNSDEILGVANFMVSDVFYEKLKTDIQHILFLESLIALIVLFFVWTAVNFLIGKLNIEILTQKKITRELEQAKNTAEKASQTKSDFLANMSHEIRTPLNAISGMAYILFKTPLNKRQQDLLGKLDSAAKLLLNLINDLLDFSKIEAGKVELEAVPFKLDEVLDNLSKLIMDKAAEKELDILYRTSQDIPQYLIGDPLRLGQVLLNLVNNSLKFTEQGHILLSVELAKQQTDTQLPATGNNTVSLKFSISDTGIGIKKQDIDKLFNSFTQADSSTTRKYGGTGLGLSICKQLIHLMGGDIHVNSEYGQGSTFSFIANFAIEQHGVSEQKPKHWHFAAEIQPEYALVVDDNHLAQTIFKQMLESFGFKVLIASNAQQGLDLLKQYSKKTPVQLVLMDWKLPGMDGLEATRLIKTGLDLKRVPAVIMVSAYANIDDKDKNITPWDDYLVKPVSQSILYDSIVTLFSEQQLTINNYSDDKVNNIVASGLSNKKVLLTEDNKTNQEVACTLLGEFKLQVDIANNGKEAVEAVKKSNYDLIFMDLQMPEMDGFEATRIIRTIKDYKHTPIIAMTAHAMQSDRQKCLDASMSDYLTKPIDVEKFFDMVGKWLGGENKHQQKIIPADEKSSLFKLNSINLDNALKRVRGNQELLLHLLSNFKKQKYDMADRIENAIFQNDFLSAKELAHSLKGEAGTLEATELYSIAKNLEQQLSEQTSSSYADNLSALKQAISDVIIDISNFEQHMQKPSQAESNGSEQTDGQALDKEQNNKAQNDKGLDMQILAPQLKELANLLRDNNLRAKTVAKNLTAELDRSCYKEQWNDLLSALSELDFEFALTILYELVKPLELSLDDVIES